MAEDSGGRVRLYLVRHGETAANVELRYLGSRDDPLDELGLGQARELGRAFSALPVRAVYSSPLRRATDTAACIAAALSLECRREARLREASFGDWEGMGRTEVLGRSPRDAELLDRWERDSDTPPPGGESLLHVQERVLGLADELLAIHRGESVVLVSHVSPIKALLAAALNLSLDSVRRFFLDPATVSVVDWGASPVLRLFNSHSHLGWTRARWMGKI